MADRKKRIFSWNHISDRLTEDQVDELKSYYKAYHRKCWAYKQAVKRYKKFKLIGNTISVLTGTGGIISAVVTGGIALVAISTCALLIKSYMDFQSLDLKIQNCTYAYQSYQHLLNSIKDMLRSGDFQPSFHTELKNVDDFVTDVCPSVVSSTLNTMTNSFLNYYIDFIKCQ